MHFKRMPSSAKCIAPSGDDYPTIAYRDITLCVLKKVRDFKINQSLKEAKQ